MLATSGLALGAGSASATTPDDAPYECGGRLVDDGPWPVRSDGPTEGQIIGRIYLYYNAPTNSNCAKLENYNGSTAYLKMRKGFASNPGPWSPTDVEMSGRNAVVKLGGTGGVCIQVDAFISKPHINGESGDFRTGWVACG